MQSNAGSSQLNNGMIARFYQSTQNIGSEAGNVTRIRSQYPSGQYMEDLQLPAVRTYPSANSYAGSSAMPSNQRDQYNIGFTELTRRRIMASSCEPAWDDGSSHNHDIQSMNYFSQQHLTKNILSSNPHSWNWTHTGSSSKMPMNVGQQKHGMDRRHGSTSAGSGFTSTQYSKKRSSCELSKSSTLQLPSRKEPTSQCPTNRSSCDFNKSSTLQQPSHNEPSIQCSSNRGCELDRSSQLQQPSHQKQLPVDQTRPVFTAAEVEANERAPNIMKSINNPQSDGVNLCELSLDDSFESVWTKLTVDQSNESDLPRSQLESPHHDPSMIPNTAVNGMPANTDQQTQAMNPPCLQSNGDSASTSAWDGASTSCSIQLHPGPSTVDVNQGGSSEQLPNSPCLDREIESSSAPPGIGSFLQPVPQQSTLPQQSPVVPDPSTDPVVSASAQKVVRPKTSCGE